MTHGRNKTLRWTLTGGVFVLALMVSGCGMFSRPIQPTEPVVFVAPSAPVDPDRPVDPQPVRPRGIELVDSVDGGARFQAPSVNLYGELDGVRRTSGAPGGEANFQRHTFTAEGYDSAVSIDPSGRYMVFTSTRHYPQPKIYLQRVDGSAVTELTGDGSEDAFPTFSHDGRRIAFSSTRAGSWDIYVMDIDGRNVTQVTSGPMQDLHPSFSPDGMRLVYCSTGGRSDQWELWTVNLQTGEKRQIGFGLFPTWSPDRSTDRIAFQRARQRGSRWFSLWTLDLVDGEGTRQTEVAAGTNAAIITPTWSPDGQYLAFSTVVNPSGDRQGDPGGEQDIWVVKSDGTGRRRLTDGIGTNLMPAWAVDNRIYFVSDRAGTECIWSTRVNVPGMMTATVDTGTVGP